MADPTPAPHPDLLALRTQIDRVDRELLGLLNQRAQLALHVGELKKKEGSVAFRPEREAQVIDGLKQTNTGPLASDSVAPIWREIMSACRALETPTRVAYLGPSGTFSELAVLGFFGSSIVKVPCANFDEVFHAVSAGSADFGVVPVENSTEGVVTRSLDLFLTTPLFIIGETSLFVRHNLLRRENSLEHLTAVCAHPQALAQCHGWLSNHLPNVERRPVASNAEGARMAQQDPTVAAIASERAASEFGLHIVAPAIQDDAHNRTRFTVLAHPHQHPQPKASGHDCTSLIVSVANKPGAVHDMLVPLKRHGVSMTRFESRPARSGQWEYYFYVDLQGHPDEPHVAAALSELREVCAFFKVLGTYPIDVH
ncbi:MULTISPECIES: prephenate dehydratase [unclassified Rhizobacter]|uniref:prephenate dehydratase n=1 Tax=unclassified Rhizobacter TaxID=2640088 RepID=UPI0006F78EE5|nr:MULTISPECIES: prephenate dehydratase [unclassified Rhizobacter]KQU73332.1 chorismate mutase [Rhizobacter sp. Root29]KQW02480.1 chorismate mutase [Rhizobacter sp. Root1238]KRB12529.1 chorismate mutase [Rhizobacter sp. Root16D2]